MPHLAELVKLHEGDPFALIGINYNDSPEAFRKGLEDFKVTWISAYQEQGTGPISSLFRVKGYPTYFLIDAEGKIVKTSHSSTDYDEPIADLLKAMAE